MVKIAFKDFPSPGCGHKPFIMHGSLEKGKACPFTLANNLYVVAP